VKVDERSFTVFDENRARIYRSKAINSIVGLGEEAKHLYLLNHGVRWVRKNMPGASVVLTMPHQPEMKVRREAA
jgi:hypothetical protein